MVSLGACPCAPTLFENHQEIGTCSTTPANGTTWGVPEDAAQPDASLPKRYAAAFYWVIMVSIGADRLPQGTAQSLFTSLVALAGIFIQAAVIGSAAGLIADINAITRARASQLRKIVE